MIWLGLNIEHRTSNAGKEEARRRMSETECRRREHRTVPGLIWFDSLGLSWIACRGSDPKVSPNGRPTLWGGPLAARFDWVGFTRIESDGAYGGTMECGGRVRGVGANGDAAFTGMAVLIIAEQLAKAVSRPPSPPLPPQSILANVHLVFHSCLGYSQSPRFSSWPERQANFRGRAYAQTRRRIAPGREFVTAPERNTKGEESSETAVGRDGESATIAR